MSNFYKLCNRYPPVLVRLLARKGGRAMTTREIALAAGKPAEARCGWLEEVSWDGVPLNQIRTLTRACGLDFTSRADINRSECYFRRNKGRPTFRYLTSDKLWESYYLPLILSWRRRIDVVPPELPKPIQRMLKGLK